MFFSIFRGLERLKNAIFSLFERPITKKVWVLKKKVKSWPLLKFPQKYKEKFFLDQKKIYDPLKYLNSKNPIFSKGRNISVKPHIPLKRGEKML